MKGGVVAARRQIEHRGVGELRYFLPYPPDYGVYVEGPFWPACPHDHFGRVVQGVVHTNHACLVCCVLLTHGLPR
jgi:hypothetical protein